MMNKPEGDSIEQPVTRKVTTKDYFRFIGPSLVGFLLFLVPVKHAGEVTILMAIMADWLKGLAADMSAVIAVAVIVISAILTILVSILMPRLARGKLLGKLFHVRPIWVGLRCLGAIAAVMTLLQIGPDWVISKATGQLVLYDLVSVILTYLFVAIALLPFLTDYGMMEFVGTLLRNVFRRLFGLPGRSCIDALASWIGAGTVGVLITTQQYERGFYTAREAAVIATNFSVVSLAFSLLVLKVIGLGNLFIPYYLTTVFTGICLALLMPRLPPLRGKKDIYYPPVGKQIDEEHDNHDFGSALGMAVNRARKAPGVSGFFRSATVNVLDIWLGLLPAVMAIATIAMALAEYTPVFEWISIPLVPLLELLAVPESQLAATALMLGFADMFLPPVVGKTIESEFTRFVVVTTSVIQLIYMSEIGVLILKSKIPLNLLELFIIFMIRTAIAIPIVVFVARMFVF